MEPSTQFAQFVPVDSSATDRFLASLTSVPHELRRHEPARHARHLAALWNVPLAETGRATLFLADGAAVLVLVPANRKISAPALRALLGAADLRVLRADRGVGRVGWAGLPGSPAALPAIPALFGAEMFIDELALDPPRIVLPIDAERSVGIAPADYVSLVDARHVSIAGRTKLPEQLVKGVGRARFELA